MSHIAHHPIITLIGGGKVILFSRMYFRYFIIISPWKRAWPFIRTNLNPIYSMMLCDEFGWNRPIGSGNEDLLVSSMYFLLFRYYLTLENGVAFIRTNLNPDLCHVWLKLTEWFRKRWKYEKYTERLTYRRQRSERLSSDELFNTSEVILSNIYTVI